MKTLLRRLNLFGPFALVLVAWACKGTQTA